MQACRRILSQDSYWGHTVSVFTAFSPNRIGEYDTHCRITVVLAVVLTGVPYVGSGTVSVSVLGSEPIGKGLGKVSCDKIAGGATANPAAVPVPAFSPKMGAARITWVEKEKKACID